MQANTAFKVLAAPDRTFHGMTKVWGQQERVKAKHQADDGYSIHLARMLVLCLLHACQK